MTDLVPPANLGLLALLVAAFLVWSVRRLAGSGDGRRGTVAQWHRRQVDAVRAWSLWLAAALAWVGVAAVLQPFRTAWVVPPLLALAGLLGAVARLRRTRRLVSEGAGESVRPDRRVGRP